MRIKRTNWMNLFSRILFQFDPNNLPPQSIYFAKSAGAVEYTDCTSADGQEPPPPA